MNSYARTVQHHETDKTGIMHHPNDVRQMGA